MQAVVLHSPGQLAVGHVDTPVPRPHEVLLRVTHTGICGTDLKIFTGAMPAARPVIMGHEIVGEVVSGEDRVGEDGERVRRGDRVLVDPVLYCGACFDCEAGRTHLCRNGAVIGRETNGGFAEFVVAPRTHVFPLPDSIESRTAPLIQVLTTCLHGQRRAGISPGHSVVVAGLGVSGQLHAQLAKARGARPVIGVSRSAWKRDLAQELGADLTVAPGDAGSQQIAAATGGHGADVVIETTGVVSSFADALAMVRPGGTVLLFGIYTATEGTLPFYQLYFKEPTVICARAAKGEDFPESIELVARGQVKLSRLVTQVLPLTELAQAIEMLKTDVDGRMKIILEH
jgi:2-desacetyl-2-hydroxyethyl bacteriochlorophyllide A dehydrogenase